MIIDLKAQVSSFKYLQDDSRGTVDNNLTSQPLNIFYIPKTIQLGIHDNSNQQKS